MLLRKLRAVQDRKLALWKRIAFPIAALVLVFGFLEGMLRVVGLRTGFVRGIKRISYMPPEVFEESIGMWRPGAKGRVAWPTELAFDFEIDERGFRGFARDASARKAGPTGESDVFRILCLGDSTTFSLFVDEKDTYPRQLELALESRGLDVEVINGGSPNWGTHDHVRFLRERAHKLAPDFVVHLFCSNDLHDIGDDPEGDVGTFVRWKDRIEGGMSLVEFLRINTALGELHARLNVFWKAWRQGPSEAAQFGDPAMPGAEAWQPFQSAHSALARECKARGIGLVTACFPDPGKRTESPHEAEVARVADKDGVPFIPLWKLFRAAEAGGAKLYHLPIDDHANADGCRLLARSIADALFEKRLGPCASPK